MWEYKTQHNWDNVGVQKLTRELGNYKKKWPKSWGNHKLLNTSESGVCGFIFFFLRKGESPNGGDLRPHEIQGIRFGSWTRPFGSIHLDASCVFSGRPCRASLRTGSSSCCQARFNRLLDVDPTRTSFGSKVRTGSDANYIRVGRNLTQLTLGFLSASAFYNSFHNHAYRS